MTQCRIDDTLLRGLSFPAKADDLMSFGCLNGLFVLGRSMGFIGHHLDQLRTTNVAVFEIFSRFASESMYDHVKWMGIGPFSFNRFLGCVAIRLKQPLYRHPWDDMTSALSPPSTDSQKWSLISGWNVKDITYISELAGQA